MVALGLMTALLVKHFIFDFPFQTKRMLDDKGTYLEMGGVHHAFAHGIGTAIVFSLMGFYSLAGTLAVIDILIHYHIDYIKVKLNKWKDLKPDNKMFWNALGADQLAHGLTYVLLVYLALLAPLKG